MAATPLPLKWVMERASDMNLSMPRISARPATGTEGTTARVAASVIKPEPVTPEAPLLVFPAWPSAAHQGRQGLERIAPFHDGEKDLRHFLDDQWTRPERTLA